VTDVYFYGLNGEVLGRYRRKQWPDGVWGWEMKETFAYLAGIRVARRDGATTTSLSAWSAYRHDRLSSVGDGSTYLPYGEERSVTANDTHKFATYYRDSSSGLDYADQRYYSSTYGRFLTSDPYRASGGPSDPGSWNRYAYVQGDPVNLTDPAGLFPADTQAYIQCLFAAPYPTFGYGTSQMEMWIERCGRRLEHDEGRMKRREERPGWTLRDQDMGRDCHKPLDGPPSADLNDNIEGARLIVIENSQNGSGSVGNLAWFYMAVRNKGPMDYKQIDPKWEAFGNFNYGAVGAALGLDLGFLLKMAGWASQTSLPPDQLEGTIGRSSLASTRVSRRSATI
jgi:RHS repeat-associated protein